MQIFNPKKKIECLRDFLITDRDSGCGDRDRFWILYTGIFRRKYHHRVSARSDDRCRIDGKPRLERSCGIVQRPFV